MNARKLFWLGFCGGIIRIFGVLALLFTLYVALASLIGGDWRPVLMALPFSSLLYLFGWTLETVAEIGNKVNKIEAETNTNASIQ